MADMRPVTAEFLEHITQPHRLATRFTILQNGEDLQEIDVVDGTVTLDATAAVRGRADLTIADPALVPTGPDSLLAPYGNEIRVERGLHIPGRDAPELVSLGVLRIEECTITDEAGGIEIQLTCHDRAQKFVDARFEEPHQIAAGTAYSTAILNLLLDADPNLEWDFLTTLATTPSLLFEEGADRWDAAQGMARSIGCELFFDGDGVCRLIPPVSIGALTPAAVISEQHDDIEVAPALTQAGRQWSREGTFNRVIATGENTGEAAPARAVATDDNPLSPTYYYGPFGRVPRFYASPFITTDAQAQSAAESILARELGTTQSVTFGSLVLPHLEPFDVVTIRRERAGIDEDHILDQVTIPLTADAAMSAQTRAQVVFG